MADTTTKDYSAYQNKYLDGAGVGYLWEKIKSAISSESAKIIFLEEAKDFSNGKHTVTVKETQDLLGNDHQDVMIDLDGKLFYRYNSTTTNGTTTLEWMYYNNSGEVTILSYNATTYVLAKSTKDVVANKVYINKSSASNTNYYLLSTQSPGNNFENDYFTPSFTGYGTNNTTLYFDTVAFTLKSDSKNVNISGNAATATQATYATKLGNATTSYAPEETLTGSATTIPTSSAIATYVTSQISDVVAIAEGKTKSYTINAADNEKFQTTENSTVVYTLQQSLTDVKGNNIPIESMNIGDIVFLTETNYPDRWFGYKSESMCIFYPIDAKTDLSGYQTKLPQLGSNTEPIYTSGAGTITACDKYAGGTKVKLNGTDQNSKDIEIYAPTASGSSTEVLVGGGNNQAPTWTNLNGITVGTATVAGAVGHDLTFSNTGNGDATGTTYNGSTAKIISYNSIGAVAANSTSTAHSTAISNTGATFLVDSKTGTVSQVTLKQTPATFSVTSKNGQSIEVNSSQVKLWGNNTVYAFISKDGLYVSNSEGSQDYKVVDYSMTLTTDDIEAIIKKANDEE